MTNVLGFDQGEEDDVILLTLVAVNCGHFVGGSYEGVPQTSLLYDISDQMLLSVVRRQDWDLVRRVTKETQVHEYSHHVFCLGQILKKEKINIKKIKK